MYDVVVKR